MKKVRKEIRNLIFLLSIACGIAFLAVVGLVYQLGSTGSYRARSVLVAPDLALNKIEFTQRSQQGHGWGRFSVSQDTYKRFYNLISSEKSIIDLTDEIIGQFSWSVPASLKIFLSASQDPFFREGKLLQQIQFADGGELFRVQLNASQAVDVPLEEWVYFSYPGIYEQAVKLFAHT